MDEVTVNNKKKRSKKIFLVGIVAIILICLFLVYILVFNKPKNIFLNSINNEYKKFDEFVDSNLKNLKNSDEVKTISGNLTFDLDASFENGIIDEDVSALLEELNKFYKLLAVLAIAGLPIMLIVVEPDFGTATAYIFATVFILFVSGIDKKYIFAMNGQTGKFVGDLPVDKAAAMRWTFLLAAIFTAASYGVAWALHLMGLI